MDKRQIKIIVAGKCNVGKSTIIDIIEKALHDNGISSTINDLGRPNTCIYDRINAIKDNIEISIDNIEISIDEAQVINDFSDKDYPIKLENIRMFH